MSPDDPTGTAPETPSYRARPETTEEFLNRNDSDPIPSAKVPIFPGWDAAQSAAFFALCDRVTGIDIIQSAMLALSMDHRNDDARDKIISDQGAQIMRLRRKLQEAVDRINKLGRAMGSLHEAVFAPSYGDDPDGNPEA